MNTCIRLTSWIWASIQSVSRSSGVHNFNENIGNRLKIMKQRIFIFNLSKLSKVSNAKFVKWFHQQYSKSYGRPRQIEYVTYLMNCFFSINSFSNIFGQTCPKTSLSTTSSSHVSLTEIVAVLFMSCKSASSWKYNLKYILMKNNLVIFSIVSSLNFICHPLLT